MTRKESPLAQQADATGRETRRQQGPGRPGMQDSSADGASGLGPLSWARGSGGGAQTTGQRASPSAAESRPRRPWDCGGGEGRLQPVRSTTKTTWSTTSDPGQWREGGLPLPLRATAGLSPGAFAEASGSAADSVRCFVARSISTSLSLSVRKAAGLRCRAQLLSRARVLPARTRVPAWHWAGRCCSVPGSRRMARGQ